MFIEKVFTGMVLSMPAGLLIFAGLADGTEPTAWILWGIAFFMGVPWNIAALFVFYLLIYVLAIAAKYIPFISEIHINGWMILFWIVVGSGVIGAHINGILLVNRSRGRPKKKVIIETNNGEVVIESNEDRQKGFKLAKKYFEEPILVFNYMDKTGIGRKKIDKMISTGEIKAYDYKGYLFIDGKEK
jgi:hypothetical protein